MVDAQLLGVIVGAVIGGGLTFLAQRTTVDRTLKAAQTARLREERMEAYSAYAATVLEYRRAVIDRWKIEAAASHRSSEGAGIGAEQREEAATNLT